MVRPKTVGRLCRPCNYAPNLMTGTDSTRLQAIDSLVIEHRMTAERRATGGLAHGTWVFVATTAVLAPG